jgi:hypothetical protein
LISVGLLFALFVFLNNTRSFMVVELPDLFRFSDGSRVQSPADWSRRRVELLDVLQAVEYGRMPAAPRVVEGELLMRNRAGTLNARQLMYRIAAGDGTDAGAVSFILNLFFPDGDGPHPAVIDGDACWPTMTPEIIRTILGSGYLLAHFNRLEIATDNKATGRKGGIFRVYPDGDYGTLAAWAWGYSRVLDFLSRQDFVRPDQVIAIGASRGGKTALLAGAADERFALTVANGSGCCGAGCFRFLGPQAETLPQMIDHAGFWLSPRLPEFIGRENELPLDQHFLKAAIAPRAMLTTEAMEDLTANPPGTWLTHAAAREVYRFLGAGERIGISYRPGRHEHTLVDWQATLEFADWQFRGIRPGRSFDFCPFEDLRS